MLISEKCAKIETRFSSTSLPENRFLHLLCIVDLVASFVTSTMIKSSAPGAISYSFLVLLLLIERQAKRWHLIFMVYSSEVSRESSENSYHRQLVDKR
jgi:hypothetical protein